MRKSHLNRLLEEIKINSTMRSALVKSEGDDVRRVKSFLRTMIARKTTRIENLWVAQEITARGKKYLAYHKGLPISEHDPRANTIELPHDLHVASKDRLTLYPGVYFLLERTAQAKQERIMYEHVLHAAVHLLPIWEPWGSRCKGLGELNLAAILSGSGDLWRFPTVAKLWKRMGVGLIDEHGIQRKVRDKELAVLFGYSPFRHSNMFLTSETLMKGSKTPEGDPGPYKVMYDDRKVYEQTKDGITLNHAHKRALRYCAKHLLKELWQVWRVHCP